jgi:hypothetical protein
MRMLMKLKLHAMSGGETIKLEYACERCGGVAITRDAWAEWDVEQQAWKLSEVFDFAFCHECHRETRVAARPAA